MNSNRPNHAGLSTPAARPSTDRPSKVPCKVAMPQVPTQPLAQPIMRKDGAIGRATGATGSLKRYQR